MLNVVLLIGASVIGGLIGGMGMGGGTLMIPLLIVFCGMEQHAAQAVNLVAFIPMSIIALIIHSKNKLVEYKKVLPVVLPSLVTSVLCSFLALKVNGKALSKFYGIFLILLGVYQMITVTVSYVKSKKNEKPFWLPRKREEESSEGNRSLTVKDAE